MIHFKQLLSYQFMKLHLELVKSLREALRPIGITEKNYAIMQAIGENPGISQNGIAEIMEKDKTLIGQVLDKLEEKKLAKREPVEGDRRAHALFLTDEGKKIVDDYIHIMLEGEKMLLASLSQEDEIALRRIVGKLMDQQA